MANSREVKVVRATGEVLPSDYAVSTRNDADIHALLTPPPVGRDSPRTPYVLLYVGKADGTTTPSDALHVFDTAKYITRMDSVESAEKGSPLRVNVQFFDPDFDVVLSQLLSVRNNRQTYSLYLQYGWTVLGRDFVSPLTQLCVVALKTSVTPTGMSITAETLPQQSLALRTVHVGYYSWPEGTPGEKIVEDTLRRALASQDWRANYFSDFELAARAAKHTTTRTNSRTASPDVVIRDVVMRSATGRKSAEAAADYAELERQALLSYQLQYLDQIPPAANVKLISTVECEPFMHSGQEIVLANETPLRFLQNTVVPHLVPKFKTKKGDTIVLQEIPACGESVFVLCLRSEWMKWRSVSKRTYNVNWHEKSDVIRYDHVDESLLANILGATGSTYGVLQTDKSTGSYKFVRAESSAKKRPTDEEIVNNVNAHESTIPASNRTYSRGSFERDVATFRQAAEAKNANKAVYGFRVRLEIVGDPFLRMGDWVNVKVYSGGNTYNREEGDTEVRLRGEGFRDDAPRLVDYLSGSFFVLDVMNTVANGAYTTTLTLLRTPEDTFAADAVTTLEGTSDQSGDASSWWDLLSDPFGVRRSVNQPSNLADRISGR